MGNVSTHSGLYTIRKGIYKAFLLQKRLIQTLAAVARNDNIIIATTLQRDCVTFTILFYLSYNNKLIIEPVYLYGDPLYRATFGVINPYKGRARLTSQQLRFNKAIVRVAVEQGFVLTRKQWSNTSFSLAMKTGLQPVAAYYFTGILLTNCYTCIRSK